MPLLHTWPVAHGRDASHCAQGPMQPWQMPALQVWPVGHARVPPHCVLQLVDPGVQAWQVPIASQVWP
jgi:hypothetical protein